MTIDWGDGILPQNYTGSTDIIKTYSAPGEYTVKISGTLPALAYWKDGDAGNNTSFWREGDKILRITQWGSIAWSSFYGAFSRCRNLNVTATDTPNLTNVTNMSDMFRSCTNLTGNTYFNYWNVSNVRTMGATFINCSNFNQPLNNWNVSGVTYMGYMFYYCTKFNQPLNNWNVCNVTNMDYMFDNCRSFNQNLSTWKVPNISATPTSFNFFTGISALPQWGASCP